MKKKPQLIQSTKEAKPIKKAAGVATSSSASPSRAVRASEEKWTAPVINLGHTTLPSLLFWAQARLGLSPEQLNVLLQLIEHWWNADRNPHPKKDTIAKGLFHLSGSARMELCMREEAV